MTPHLFIAHLSVTVETVLAPQDGARERGVSGDSYQEVFPPECAPLEWGQGPRDQPPSWTTAPSPEGDILDEVGQQNTVKGNPL